MSKETKGTQPRCSHRRKTAADPAFVSVAGDSRGAWTKEEDDKLRSLVHGQTNISSIKWSTIASDMDMRNSKQYAPDPCRQFNPLHVFQMMLPVTWAWYQNILQVPGAVAEPSRPASA